MDIVYKTLDEINEYKLNAKKHPDRQIKGLAEMIKRFGFKQPIVLDQDDTIIIGHGRKLAASQLGMDKVPCVYCEGLTDAEIKAFRLMDNRISETGWDSDLLKLDIDSFDFDFAQFDVDFDSITGDDDSEPNDFSEATLDQEYLILVTCDSDHNQRKLLEDFEKRGIECKALIS